MLKKPLTHLFIILGLIALWFATSSKSHSQPEDEGDTPPVQSSVTHPSGLELDLPSEDVKVLQQQGSTALLHIDMEKHSRMEIELEFSGPSKEWSFNLGDSNTNNGWGGDSVTAINDAEIQILNGNLEIYGSDLLDHYPEYPARQRFMKKWDNVVENGGLVRLEIADGEVTYIDRNGRRDSYQHPALFALAGQDDAEAGVNYDLYLGANRVVSPGRIGSGLKKVKVRFID